MNTLVFMCVRRLSCYKSVPRPTDFKVVSRGEYEIPSLAQHLADRIRLGGPISVADYMKAVLVHPKKGYYMKGDVFGQRGDFTTSPEISPLFGEMLGVWFCHELRKIGSPRPLQLIELGPGRGTLMADVLRVFKKIPPGDDGVSIHFVEVSERLAQLQAQRLAVTDLTTTLDEDSPFYQAGVTEAGIQVHWYKTIRQIPRGFSAYIAHEFFDALPVHKFERVDGSWREILVSLKNPEEQSSDPEFVMTIGKTANPTHSVLIDQNEQRTHVEISPESGEIVGQVAERLEEDGGIGLIIDYGHFGTKGDTFRGFKAHALHDPLNEPGSADLTADVDFKFIRRAAGDKVCAYGPVPQGDFLKNLGIYTRLEKVLENVPQEHQNNLRSGVKMIVDDMGQRFQFLALFPAVLEEHHKKFPVVGFHDSR